jgi:hypothetical protein
MKFFLSLVDLFIFGQFSGLLLVSSDQILGFDKSADSKVGTKLLTKVSMFEARIKSNIEIGFLVLLPSPGEM